MVATFDVDYSTDELRWNAVVERDRRADGAFFYGVKTTGVYCGPTCSSRVPNRENVTFFLTREAAERAGYRACKRCKPGESAAGTPSYRAVIRACKLIEQAEEMPALNELADSVGFSPYHFHRLFKRVVGVTPKGYASTVRVRRLRHALLEGRPVTSAIFSAGFGSNSRCYDGAAAMLGMTPTKYKNGAAGLLIRFAVTKCYLGWLLVAATEKGICVIDFGDTPDILQKRLLARFPKARLEEGDAEFSAWITRILAFLETPDRGLDLPLDIQGTAFQQRVWKALQAIPAGSVMTYSEIAERLGSASRARAVARACASNSLALAIPCHRVVRSDGKPSGYRWGFARKQTLLEREAGAGEAQKPERNKGR